MVFHAPIAADSLQGGGEGRGGSVVNGVTCTDCSYEVAVREEVVVVVL